MLGRLQAEWKYTHTIFHIDKTHFKVVQNINCMDLKEKAKKAGST